MKILDRYILKGFVFSFAAVFVSMVALTVMVHMIVNVDEFLEVGAEAEELGAWSALGHVVSYYFFRQFEFFQWLWGPATLVGAAFAIARMNKTNEVTAVKASGVSVYRLIWPMIVAGIGISGLYVVNQELVLPKLVERLTVEPSDRGAAGEFRVRYVRDENNTLIHAPRFIPGEQAMAAVMRETADGQTEIRQPVSIILRDRETGDIEYFIEARRAEYVPEQGGWRLIGATGWTPERHLRPGAAEEPAPAETVTFFKTNIDPQWLKRHRSRDAYQYLSFRELQRLLGESSMINADTYAVAMHQHFSKPILNVLVLLLGLPFIVGREGKNYFISVGTCIGLFVMVLGVEYACTHFGSVGGMKPALAAYLPVLIFSPLAILAMDSIRT